MLSYLKIKKHLRSEILKQSRDCYRQSLFTWFLLYPLPWCLVNDTVTKDYDRRYMKLRVGRSTGILDIYLQGLHSAGKC